MGTIAELASQLAFLQSLTIPLGIVLLKFIHSQQEFFC